MAKPLVNDANAHPLSHEATARLPLGQLASPAMVWRADSGGNRRAAGILPLSPAAPPEVEPDGRASESRRHSARPVTAPAAATSLRVLSLPDPLRRAWYLGVAVFAIQFVGLILWSWYLWSRFDLGDDMAAFGQAFSQIGSGHLNPRETSFVYHYPNWGYPFYQSAFELIMWPLALLYTATRSLFTLLIVQDAALVGAGLAAFRWGLEYLARLWPKDRHGATLVAAGLAILLVVNPWTYWTASFDFHFEPIACLFAVLAARDGWQGRRRAWLWLALLLACGDVAATYGVAVGLTLVLADSRTRRMGAGMALASVAWILMIGVLHGARGSGIQAYGYLAGHPVQDGVDGMVAIVVGIITHPQRALSMLDGRWHALYQYLAGAGLIGVASAIAIAPVIVVLGTNGLNSGSIWVTDISAFQSLVIVFFMGVGAVSVITWLVRRKERAARVLGCVIGVAGLAQACYLSSQVTPRARTWFAAVSKPTATELARVQRTMPLSAEAIVSINVIGRFAARRDLYTYGIPFPGGEIVPVNNQTVYFVFVLGPEVPPESISAVVRKIEAQGARLIDDANGVIELIWNPPRGMTHTRL